MDKRTPITWLSDILTEELWAEEDFQGGDTPLPPILTTVWEQLNHFLGHSQLVRGRTIREWRLSLTSGKPRCGHCCIPHTTGNTSCFRPRCSIQGCDKFFEPCNTCQTIPNRPNPPQERIGDKRKANSTITSFNLHTTGRHFIEKVTVVDHTFPTIQVEVGQTPTATRFQATIRD